MKMEHAWKGWFIAAAALLAILSTPVPSTASLKQFHALMNGPQETPPNASTAIGIAHLTFDTGTNTLCFSITYSGLVGGAETAAHIHGPAVPGIAAVVVVVLPAGNPKSGCVVAPPPPFDKKDLFKNLYYVNVHNGGFPAGEIRGQILRIK